MNDTVSLLREVCQGCKYATESIEIAKNYATDKRMASLLMRSAEEHERIKRETSRKIRELGAKEAGHPSMGAAMTKAHMSISLMLNPKPERMAELMINGCNMGVKTVAKYKNRYGAASVESVALADSLITAERDLSYGMLGFLK